MKNLFIAALIALACLSFAQNNSTNANVPELHAYAIFVPSGAPFSVVNFTFQNASAYAVISGGEIYAIFTPGMLGMEPVTDSNTIDSALHDYYVSIGFSPGAADQFAPVHAGIQSISGTRRAGEAECLRLSGNVNTACNDFESCRSACLGTPFCPNFAYGGAPGEFINVLLDFRNRTLALDRAYALENFTYRIYASSRTKENLVAYLASLDSINRAAGAASQMQLYTDYSFCATPDYSLPQITNLQLSAQRLYSSASRFFSTSSEAERIKNRTLAGIEGKYKAPAPPPQNNASANGTVEANLSDAPIAAPLVAPSPLSNTGIAIIAVVLLLAAAVGAGIYFFMKRRRRHL